MGENKKEWYISSKGKGLSATISGLSINGIVVAIIVIARLFGYNVPQGDSALFVTGVVTVIGTLITLFGLGRKIVYKIKKVK